MFLTGAFKNNVVRCHITCGFGLMRRWQVRDYQRLVTASRNTIYKPMNYTPIVFTVAWKAELRLQPWTSRKVQVRRNLSNHYYYTKIIKHHCSTEQNRLKCYSIAFVSQASSYPFLFELKTDEILLFCCCVIWNSKPKLKYSQHAVFTFEKRLAFCNFKIQQLLRAFLIISLETITYEPFQVSVFCIRDGNWAVV